MYLGLSCELIQAYPSLCNRLPNVHCEPNFGQLYRVAERLLDTLYLTYCFWCQVTWATLYVYMQYNPVIKTLVYATRHL